MRRSRNRGERTYVMLGNVPAMGNKSLVTGVLLMCLNCATLHAVAYASKWEISHPVYTPDITIAESTVASYMAMSEFELRALITTEGGKGTNETMKRVAYDMARLYQKTGEDAYADRAVVLLERFAEVVPRWPMLSEDGTATPLDQVDWGAWDNGGLWGIWLHTDLSKARELVLAYDFVVASGAMERRGPNVRKFIEENLLRYTVEFNLKCSYLLRVYDFQDDGRAPFEFGNMGGNRIEGIMPFGLVFDPHYIHLVVDWLRRYPSVGYFRDGVWHETSPSYHEQISGRVARRLLSQLKGYSDPPGYVDPVDGTRFDDLEVEQGHETQLARIRSAMEHLTLPNDHLLALHDTHSDDRSWYVERDSSESYCYFGMRHAVLGRFSGEDQIQAHLHFGGTDGHEHYDCLNLVLWALEKELLSDGEYKKFGNRDWNESSPGHNLVVVDGKNQRGRFDGRMTPTADDAVDGLSYNPEVYGHGDSRNFGNLRLWDVTHPNIQVVEAEGENAYGREITSLYRRTLAMVEIEGPAFYLIDVFRVKGGNTHDWMLHGRLNEDYGFGTDLSMTDATGTRFDYLHLQRAAMTDSTWWSEFRSAGGATIRTTLIGHPNTEVRIGRAPAMRRQGDATFLDVRRTGGDNVFVAVHEPYKGAPKVLAVTPLECAGGADSAAYASKVVCIEIELEGGRTDYFASTLDEPPYPNRTIPGTDIAFKGRLVHVATVRDSVLWMYLLEGSSLRTQGLALSAQDGDFSHRGRITDVKRVEKGDKWNGFVTDGRLPMDGSLDNKTLLLILGDGRTEGYTILHVENRGAESWIFVYEEPGLELRENGKLTKLVYFPWHGIRGEIRFLISGSVYRDSKGNVESTAAYFQE